MTAGNGWWRALVRQGGTSLPQEVVGGLGRDDRVRLLEPPCRPAASAAERAAVLTLAHGGPLGVRELADRVAAALYRDALEHGGSEADIGILGAAAFRADAHQALEGAVNVLWTIESHGAPIRSADPVTQ